MNSAKVNFIVINFKIWLIMQFRNLKSKLRPGASASGAILNQNGSLYPDQDVPENLDNLPDRIDFIARLCSAWDFGVMPYPITLKEILKL